MKHLPIATILLLLALLAGPAVAPAAQSGPAPTATTSELLFVENTGQFPPDARFQARWLAARPG